MSDLAAGKRTLVEAVVAPRAGGPTRSSTCARPRPIVSVVIPTLNEALCLPRAIASAASPDVEILVVDGGSSDGTVALAEDLGALVVHAPRGRGSQLAAGADAAHGDLLLFLHADALLPPGYVQSVRCAMADPRCAIGAFRLRIGARGLGLRLVEWGARLRSRWLAMPYGDQGFFVRASTYREIGGFSTLPAMEDLEFLRRIRRLGSVRTLSSGVVVSPRSWQRHGVLRFTLWNVVCAVAFLLGVSPARLARLRARCVDRCRTGRRACPRSQML